MMMGGRTKIGIGRTTRVKAVSMIAWGKRREHCAHASFQILQWVGFNFPFHEIRWVLSDGSRAGNDKFSHHQPPSHLQFTGEKKQQGYKQYSVRPSNKYAEFAKKPLTCLAAILEDPTTFPLLSSTSTPSESSLCLIRPTLQMLALAEDGERKAAFIISYISMAHEQMLKTNAVNNKIRNSFKNILIENKAKHKLLVL